MTKTTPCTSQRITGIGVFAATGFAACLSIFAGSADAQEWRIEPEVRMGVEYDDNARLTVPPAPIQEIDGYILEGTLGIGYNTQRSGLKFTPRIRSRKYDEVPDVDSNDGFFDLDYSFLGRKSQFKIGSSYEIESIRTAERTQTDIDEDDPDDIPTDDTGRTFSNDKRHRFVIRPEWQYDMTERMSFGFRYTYMDVSYDESATTFLRDYTDNRLELLLGRKFSERTRGYIGAVGSRYEDDANLNQVDGTGAFVGVESDISQTTKWQAEIGYENNEHDLTGDSDSNVVGNFNIVRKLETITLLAQYRRNVAPGGNGRVTARDSVNFNFKKQFTERVSAGIGVRAYQSEGIGEELDAGEGRKQGEIAAQLTVALSRAFAVEARYTYTTLDRSDVDGTADSNNILLWVTYRPTPIIN